MEEKIAIVIPAYKCRFLRQTLDSIVVQTCRSFTVYIGDDASPQNLKEIVSDYADKILSIDVLILIWVEWICRGIGTVVWHLQKNRLFGSFQMMI